MGGHLQVLLGLEFDEPGFQMANWVKPSLPISPFQLGGYLLNLSRGRRFGFSLLTATEEHK